MQNYELRFRMPRNHPVPRLQDLRVAREILAVKRPIRMVIQFLVTLVEAVGGCEESHRIGNMNRHRQIEPPASIPHGIETSVAYGQKFSGRDVLSWRPALTFQ